MSANPTWESCSVELERLRADREAGQDVLEAASRLVHQLRALAGSASPKAPPGHAVRAAELIEEHLRVGPIDLPEGAPLGLVLLVKSYEGRRITRTIAREFAADLDVFVASARLAAANLARAEVEVVEGRRIRDLLEAYRGALDAIASRPGGHGRPS